MLRTDSAKTAQNAFCDCVSTVFSERVRNVSQGIAGLEKNAAQREFGASGTDVQASAIATDVTHGFKRRCRKAFSDIPKNRVCSVLMGQANFAQNTA